MLETKQSGLCEQMLQDLFNFSEWLFYQVSLHCPRDTNGSGNCVVHLVVIFLGDVQLPREEALLGRESSGLPHHEPHVLIREQPNQVTVSIPVIQGDVLFLELPSGWESSE